MSDFLYAIKIINKKIKNIYKNKINIIFFKTQPALKKNIFPYI